MTEHGLPGPDEPLPEGLFTVGNEIVEAGGPLDETAALNSRLEPGPKLCAPGIYYPTGQPYAGYELDTDGVAHIFDSYGIDTTAHPVAVMVSSQALDTMSEELDAQVGAFVNPSGLIIRGGEVELYMPHGIMMRDITPEDLKRRQRQLRHELGHVIWDILYTNNEAMPATSLYNRESLASMVRTGGRIGTPLSILDLLANTASHSGVQQIGSILLAGTGALAWTEPKMILWHLDKEERFANKVARQHRKIRMLKSINTNY
jgi:hypothetical protein